MQNYITPVSRVENENGLKFVIFDAPNDSNVQLYIKVRFCTLLQTKFFFSLSCAGVAKSRSKACCQSLRTDIQHANYGGGWSYCSRVNAHDRIFITGIYDAIVFPGLALPRWRPAARPNN